MGYGSRSREEADINIGKFLVVALVAVAFIVTMGVASCCITRIPPGYVGIKVNYAGSDRGVENLPSRTGWVFYNPLVSRVFEYKTFVQTVSWTRNMQEGKAVNEEISFNSKEGMIIAADISLSYSLKPDKVPAFYVKFRTDDLDVFTHGYLRNVARDLFNEVGGKYSVEDIWGSQKEALLKEIRDRLSASVVDLGVVIEQFGFIGAPRPPDNIVQAMNAKVAATQQAMQAENEKRKAEANAQIKIAQAEGEAQSILRVAQAQAEANKLLSSSITMELVQYRALDKWNGILPQIILGDGAMPMIQIPK